MRPKMLLLAFSICVGLCRCALQRDDPSRLTLSAQVESSGGHALGRSVVLPGATLHTEDQLFLTITVNQPAYLYLVLDSSVTGTSQFPTGNEELPLSAGTPRVLSKFKLDPPAGEESFLILASPRKLTGDICAEWNLVCLREAPSAAGTRGDQASKQPPPQKPPPPPPTTRTAAQRTGALQDVLKDHSVVARSDASGVARLRFDFHHVH